MFRRGPPPPGPQLLPTRPQCTDGADHRRRRTALRGRSVRRGVRSAVGVRNRIGTGRRDPGGRGARSPWHHHGTRTLYGYAVAGALTFEYGPGGHEQIRVVAGEFFRIPPGLVHRDVNPGRVEAVLVNVIHGEGLTTIDVEGPDP
ncbi:MAG: cupin domain-containing protein [Thermoplasmata archaeon]